MGILSTLAAIWNIAKWLRAEKKKMEQNVEAYLTEERAKEWRLQAEKIFKALENGAFVAKLHGVPRPIQWFFKHTKADDRVGLFGQWFLKSSKLESNDPKLTQPLYRMH